jgi:DNA-directed RNA polymerase subunit RPC12/RpoP
MIDSLMNLLFRCSHRRLSRPLASVRRAGDRHEEPYIVCLDCGKRFEYDRQKMKIVKSAGTPVSPQVRPNIPAPRARG